MAKTVAKCAVCGQLFAAGTRDYGTILLVLEDEIRNLPIDPGCRKRLRQCSAQPCNKR